MTTGSTTGPQQPPLLLLSSSYATAVLTVDHLQDAVIALEIFREVVAHLDVVPFHRVLVLLGLACAALGIDVVAAGVVWVDWARAAVVGGSGERVLVEALLGREAVGVGHLVGVADEKLAVPPLLSESKAKSTGKRDRETRREGVADEEMFSS